MELSSGSIMGQTEESSKPTTARSSGRRSPRRRAAFTDAGGQHIVKGEYGGGPIRAAQQTEGRLCGALDIPVAHQRAGFIHRKAVFPHHGENAL